MPHPVNEVIHALTEFTLNSLRRERELEARLDRALVVLRECREYVDETWDKLNGGDELRGNLDAVLDENATPGHAEGAKE